jgi:hypothetical protein
MHCTGAVDTDAGMPTDQPAEPTFVALGDRGQALPWLDQV